MAKNWPSYVELSDFVRDVPPTPMKTTVPPPVVVRLDQLVADLLKRTSARSLGDVTESELLAALVHTAIPRELPAKVAAYRNARVHQTLLDSTARRGRYRLPVRKVGRPKRP